MNEQEGRASRLSLLDNSWSSYRGDDFPQAIL